MIKPETRIDIDKDVGFGFSTEPVLRDNSLSGRNRSLKLFVIRKTGLYPAGTGPTEYFVIQQEQVSEIILCLEDRFQKHVLPQSSRRPTFFLRINEISFRIKSWRLQIIS